jgi:hypothetical protein
MGDHKAGDHQQKAHAERVRDEGAHSGDETEPGEGSCDPSKEQRQSARQRCDRISDAEAGHSSCSPW